MPSIKLTAEQIPAPGRSRLLLRDGLSIALCHVEGRLYALNDSCPHAGASLAGGRLVGRTLQCPAHGLQFDVASGCMNARHAGFGVATYPVHQIEAGAGSQDAGCWVIELPDHQAGNIESGLC